MPHLDRITQHPAVMGGKACIRGMRVTVSMIVGQIGAGHSIEQVLADFPYLEREDISGYESFAPVGWIPAGERLGVHPLVAGGQGQCTGLGSDGLCSSKQFRCNHTRS